MKLLTEDERFREYLMGFDEYKLCEEAKEYIPTAVKRQSLISCAAYLSDFIVDNLNENAIDIEAPEELQQIQVISFIESLPRQCIQSFYQNYMESYGVIEDLMIHLDRYIPQYQHLIELKGMLIHSKLYRLIEHHIILNLLYKHHRSLLL